MSEPTHDIARGVYLVRVSMEMLDKLIADESAPVVVVGVEDMGDGTYDMHMRTPEVIGLARARVQWVRGMCTDEEPHHLIDQELGRVLDILDGREARK
jgi:hypothetical protein